MTERIEKMKEIYARRKALLNKLVEPAKAALHQMQDAGMKNGAAPLAEIIFQIEAVDDEAFALATADPEGTLRDIVGYLKSGRDGFGGK